MPKFAGSLLGGIENAISEGFTVGVVIVDEQSKEGTAFFEETFNQQKVIEFVKKKSLSIWVVEVNPTGRGPNLPTHSALRDMLPAETPVVTKKETNAFTGTNLHDLLQASSISAFVLMGFRTNCCCEQTAVGGRPKLTSKEKLPGATQHGYEVLTCAEVLRGGEATWWNEPGVRFFDHL